MSRLHGPRVRHDEVVRPRWTAVDRLEARVLVPALEEKLSKYEKVRLLYVLGDDFDKYTGGAAWEDAKVGMKHLTAFDRVAVVTDVDWIESMIKALGFAIPAEVRKHGAGFRNAPKRATPSSPRQAAFAA